MKEKYLNRILGAIFICLFVAFVTFAIFSIVSRVNYQNSAIIQCMDLGYQAIYERNNNMYCISIGPEPRIMHLATVAELKR